MIERSRFSRIATAAVLAAGFSLAGVAGAGTALAQQAPPKPAESVCKNRQVKEINGYWHECKGGKWVKLPPIGRA